MQRQLLLLVCMSALLFFLSLFSETFSLQFLSFSNSAVFHIITAFLMSLVLGIHMYKKLSSEATKPYRKEFLLLTNDILFHEEFSKLKDYHHHANHIYDHVVRVAYISYAISKVLGFDYASAARGGLLHDFFLYDWRERKATDLSRSLHGREHPFIALENARKYFIISDLEEDIIVKHMFPKTRAIPQYKESFVVSISDKLSAIYEYVQQITQIIPSLFRRRHKIIQVG